MNEPERSGVRLIRQAKLIVPKGKIYGGLTHASGPPGYVGFAVKMSPASGVTLTTGEGSNAKITIQHAGVYFVQTIVSVQNDGGMVADESSFALAFCLNGVGCGVSSPWSHLHKTAIGTAIMASYFDLDPEDYLQVQYSVAWGNDTNIEAMAGMFYVLRLKD